MNRDVPSRWADAARAAARLTAADRRALGLLVACRLAPAAPLGQLVDLAGQAGIYGSLAGLRAAGLVGRVVAPLRAGHAPALFHLTDLGLAAAALDAGVDPAGLARAAGLHGRDLAALALRLPLHLGILELASALAAAGGAAGTPELLALEEPWVGAYRRPDGREGVARLPARVGLGWGGDEGPAAAYLLLPDLGAAPPQAWRRMLGHWRVYGAGLLARGTAPPTLLIATAAGGRAREWAALLAEIGRRGVGAIPPARVVTWEDLATELAGVTPQAGGPTRAGEPASLARELRVALLAPTPPDEPLPGLVGAPFAAADPPLSRMQRPRAALAGRRWGPVALGRAALALSPADWRLLDLVARHPLLPLASLATLLGWRPAWARYRRNALLARGLLCAVGADEAGDLAARDLTELTFAGARLVCGRWGLSIPEGVRLNGLAGGGPARPVGARARLLRHPAHTLGADEIFVRLCRAARRAGGDTALVAWRNAAASRAGTAHPDGYGVLRQRGRLHGFLVEYDRATESRAGLRRKARAYARARALGAFDREYHGCPTILFITASEAAEGRFLEALRDARALGLPVLLTTEGRLAREPRGPLGAIWRDAASAVRRPWPGG